MCLISLLMCVKFKGNPRTILHFMASVQEEEKCTKNKEKEQIFEGLYLRNGWCNSLYIVFTDMPAPALSIWSCSGKKLHMDIKANFPITCPVT